GVFVCWQAKDTLWPALVICISEELCPLAETEVLLLHIRKYVAEAFKPPAPLGSLSPSFSLSLSLSIPFALSLSLCLYLSLSLSLSLSPSLSLSFSLSLPLSLSHSLLCFCSFLHLAL